jgi:hypothetical protein
MAHGADHSGHCPIAAVSGLSCLVLSDLLGHLDVVSGVLQGVVQQPMIAMLVMVAALSVAVLTLPQPNLGLLPATFTRFHHEHLSETEASLRAFSRWISRLEHSPTLL